MSIPDRVECRSDFEYAQQPVAFYWQAERLETAWVISQNRTPTGKVFLVRAVNGSLFELLFNLETDEWTVRQI